MHQIAKFIYYKLMRWTLVGTFPKIDKCIIVLAPHTSNLDFFLGLLIREVMNEEFSFVGKSSLFKWPYGWYFKKMGGMSVDRTKNTNFVLACANLIRSVDRIHLTVAPEGTRKRVAKWKTGFYYIAKEAQVPIVLVAFDYGNKRIKVSKPYRVSNAITTDFETYKKFYADTSGRNKAHFTTPSL